MDSIPIVLPAPEAFGPMLQHVRGDKPPMPVGDLLPLLANADFLQLSSLRDALVQQLGKQSWTALESPAANTLLLAEPFMVRHVVNVSDERGRTALHHAAAIASLRSARALLAVGADPVARDHQGRVPMHDAAKSNGWYWWWGDFLEQTDELLGDASREQAWTAQDNCGRSPLHMLIQRGKLRWARSILQSLAKPAQAALACQSDDQGNTLLHLAMKASSGIDWRMAKMLLDAGADPFALNNRGETPAHTAARHREAYSLVTFIVMILNRLGPPAGARLARTQNNAGRTPIHILAETGGSMGVLAPSREILGLRDFDGNTALHIAIKQAKNTAIYRRSPCFDQLWKTSPHGIRNGAGHTPRQLAESLGVWLPA